MQPLRSCGSPATKRQLTLLDLQLAAPLSDLDGTIQSQSTLLACTFKWPKTTCEKWKHLRARPTLVDGQSGEAEGMQNVWAWDRHGGLVSQYVPTDLYWPVMAIREANEARLLSPHNATALATFVAGNLRLENRLGERDVVLPVPDLERSPSFHATVNGPAVARDVLLMAIDQDDTAMARDALHALSLTGGASSLIGGSGREAITEALAYPDQHVRYDAALVVARAMPTKAFPGSARVIPLLGSAVYGGAGRQAIVIGGSPQARLAAASRLESLGYDVSAEGDNWDAVVASRAADAMDIAYVMGDTNSGTDHCRSPCED